MNYKIIFIALIFSVIISCKQTKSDRTLFGFDYAKRELKEALSNKKEKQILVDTVITDKETAILVAETILFKIYGKDNIMQQRPYEVNLIDKYWVVNGTLPKDWLGGTFVIIINSVDGQIVKLAHEK